MLRNHRCDTCFPHKRGLDVASLRHSERQAATLLWGIKACVSRGMRMIRDMSSCCVGATTHYAQLHNGAPNRGESRGCVLLCAAGLILTKVQIHDPMRAKVWSGVEYARRLDYFFASSFLALLSTRLSAIASAAAFLSLSSESSESSSLMPVLSGLSLASLSSSLSPRLKGSFSAMGLGSTEDSGCHLLDLPPEAAEDESLAAFLGEVL